MLRAALIGVLAAILLAACTSGDSSSTTSTLTAEPALSTTTTADPQGAASGSSTAAPSTTVPTTTAPPVPVETIPLVEGFPEVDLLTAASGGGTRPLLEWSAVAGTDTYSVIVYSPDGRPYWTTITEETSTYVGGSIQLLEDRPGPRVSVGSSWSVMALDQQQLPLAISGIAPISP